MHDHETQECVSTLIDCLGHGLGIEIPRNLATIFWFHAQRLPQSARSDLTSLVILECQESIEKGQAVTKEVLPRIIDRVRHRLSRTASREVSIDPQASEGIFPGVPSGTSVVDVLDELLTGVSRLSPLHVAIFEMRYIEGASIEDVCKALKISHATAYRRLSDIRKTALPLLSKRA